MYLVTLSILLPIHIPKAAAHSQSRHSCCKTPWFFSKSPSLAILTDSNPSSKRICFVSSFGIQDRLF